MSNSSPVLPPLHENWLEGLPCSLNATLPVLLARQILGGWKEEDVRGLWEQTLSLFQEWKIQFGEEPTPRGLLDVDIKIETAEPWRCAGYLVNDPVDLLKHLELTQYPPFKGLVSKYSRKVILATIVLRELSESGHTSNPYVLPWLGNPHVETALKGALELMLDGVDHLVGAQTHLLLREMLPAMERQARLAALRAHSLKGAQARNAGYTALKDKLIELYNSDPARFPSFRQAARALTPELEHYAKEVLRIPWLTTDEPWQRIYDWLLSANKEGSLKGV